MVVLDGRRYAAFPCAGRGPRDESVSEHPDRRSKHQIAARALDLMRASIVAGRRDRSISSILTLGPGAGGYLDSGRARGLLADSLRQFVTNHLIRSLFFGTSSICPTLCPITFAGAVQVSKMHRNVGVSS
jgi:hypothetical protein